LTLKLNQTHQGQDNIATFVEKIEEIASKITKIQIAEQGEESAEIISKLNDSMALIAYKNNANKSIKAVLLAANNTTLADAKTAALNAEIPMRQENATVFTIGRFQRGGNGTYRGTYYRRNNYNNYNNNRANEKTNYKRHEHP